MDVRSECNTAFDNQRTGKNFLFKTRNTFLSCRLLTAGLLAFTFFSRAQPIIIEDPQSESVLTGQPVSLSVAAEGTGLRYHWMFNGRRLAVRGRTLRFRATLRRAGVYEAIVRDSSGETAISASAYIDVQPLTPPPANQPAPVIVSQPNDVTVAEHGTAVFQVTLNNSGPYTTIIWHNDNPLEGPHQIPDTIGLDVHNTKLVIPNCLNADNYNGVYWLAVTNSAGGTVSRKARLTVVPAP